MLPVALGMEAATGVFVRLDGWRQAQGRSLRLDGKGVEITLRNRGPMVRWQAQVRAVSRWAVLLDGGCSRGVVRPSCWKPAAVTSEPEGRRWRWPSRRRPQRGCSSAHDNTFAGGAVCIELGSPCLSLPTGVRLSGHCGPGWRWTTGARWGGGGRWIGGGAAAWSRPVGCPRWVHPFALDDGSGVPFASGRWPQGGGRPALCWEDSRMWAGWGGSRPGVSLSLGGRTKQPLCVRPASGGRLLSGGCGRPSFVPEAAGGGGVRSLRFGCEAGGCTAGGRALRRAQQRANRPWAGSEALRTTQPGWRSPGSGPGIDGEVGGDAARQEAPTRGWCAASSSEAGRRGRHGSSVSGNPFPLLCPTTAAVDQAIALGGARGVGLSTRRSIGRWPVERRRGQGKCRVLPFGPDGCACRKPKSGGRGLLLSGCWSSWLDEGRVVASWCQAVSGGVYRDRGG